jgi:hemolysin activation/secretion protein
MRGTVTVGLDALDATQGPGPGGDGQFVAGLLQLQVAQRLPLGLQAILRSDAQIANSRLLPLERFALGGSATVRGYRENQFLRDNGVLVSGELRVPVYRAPNGAAEIQLSTFMDFGRGWDQGQPTRGENLWSAGVGIRARLFRYLDAEVQWARSLVRQTTDLDASPQDKGFLFRATLRYP